MPVHKKDTKHYLEKAKDQIRRGLKSLALPVATINNNPWVMKKGFRSRIEDYFGHEYVDFDLNSGNMILGHAHRNVTLAVKKTTERGIYCGSVSREEIGLAEQISKQIPSITKTCFAPTEESAIAQAVWVCYQMTGKPAVLGFTGCPQAHCGQMLQSPYNDIEAACKILEKEKKNIGCVLVSPVSTECGIIPATGEFLVFLREWTQIHNVPLVFDETFTGFRSHYGGAQKQWKIFPDATCLGGILSAGFSFGAFGGNEEFTAALQLMMEQQSMKFYLLSPVMAAAGLATLKALDQDAYRTLNLRAQGLAESLNQFFENNQIQASMVRYGSSLSLFYSSEFVESPEEAVPLFDESQTRALYQSLFSKNILGPQRLTQPFTISLAHTKKEINELEENLQIFFSGASKESI